MRTASQEPDQAQAALEAIAARARGNNLVRAGVVQDAIVAAVAGRLDEPERRGAEHACHQLAGSAGTFGHLRASQLAGHLERLFADGSVAEPDTLPMAMEWVTALRDELRTEDVGWHHGA